MLQLPEAWVLIDALTLCVGSCRQRANVSTFPRLSAGCGRTAAPSPWHRYRPDVEPGRHAYGCTTPRVRRMERLPLASLETTSSLIDAFLPCSPFSIRPTPVWSRSAPCRPCRRAPARPPGSGVGREGGARFWSTEDPAPPPPPHPAGATDRRRGRGGGRGAIAIPPGPAHCRRGSSQVPAPVDLCTGGEAVPPGARRVRAAAAVLAPPPLRGFGERQTHRRPIEGAPPGRPRKASTPGEP